MTVTLPRQEAVWGAARGGGLSCGPARCSLSAGPPGHDTSGRRLSVRPAVSHSGPACAGAPFLQIRAAQLWPPLRALLGRRHTRQKHAESGKRALREHSGKTHGTAKPCHSGMAPTTDNCSTGVSRTPRATSEACSVRAHSACGPPASPV